MKPSLRSIPKECWLLLVFYLGSRLINLTLLPVFNDEAMDINIAQQLLEVDPLLPLRRGYRKLALDWLTAAFVWLFPDPLFSARLVSVFAGALTMLGLYLAGRNLYSRKIGTMAAAFYIISPLMLFHDRMLIADVLLNTCGVYTLLFSLLSLKQEGLRHGVALGLAMGLGMLSKLPGVLLLFTPLAVWALVHRIKVGRLARRLSLPYFVAGLVISPVLLLYRSRYWEQIQWKTIATSEALTISSWMELVTSNLTAVQSQVGTYLTTPILLICGLSLLLTLLRKNRQAGLLWILGLVPVLAFVGSSTGFLPPRYFLFATSPVLISIAWCIEQLSQGVISLADRSPVLSHRGLSFSRGSLAICALLVAAVSLPAVRFDYHILTDPSRAPLPSVDKYQYITGWPSGYGILEAVGWLERQAIHTQLQVITAYNRGIPKDGLLMYLHDNPRITVRQQNLAQPGCPAELSDETLFVRSRRPQDMDFAVLNPGAQLLVSYQKPGGISAIEIYACP